MESQDLSKSDFEEKKKFLLICGALAFGNCLTNFLIIDGPMVPMILNNKSMHIAITSCLIWQLLGSIAYFFLPFEKLPFSKRIQKWLFVFIFCLPNFFVYMLGPAVIVIIKHFWFS